MDKVKFKEQLKQFVGVASKEHLKDEKDFWEMMGMLFGASVIEMFCMHRISTDADGESAEEFVLEMVEGILIDDAFWDLAEKEYQRVKKEIDEKSKS